MVEIYHPAGHVLIVPWVLFCIPARPLARQSDLRLRHPFRHLRWLCDGFHPVGAVDFRQFPRREHRGCQFFHGPPLPHRPGEGNRHDHPDADGQGRLHAACLHRIGHHLRHLVLIHGDFHRSQHARATSRRDAGDEGVVLAAEHPRLRG